MHHRSIHFALFVLVVLAVSLVVGVGGAFAFGFAPHADFPTGANPSCVAVGDVNGDGKLDLVTANGNASSVSVLLGNGAGSFGAKTDFATGLGPSSVAVSDVNRDGKLDLVTANAVPNTVSVLLGNGNGTFGVKTDFTTGATPFGVAVGDINGDGNQDLVTANYTAGTVSVLLGNGAGSFAAKTDYATGQEPWSVAVDDFNGDGKQDLAVANRGSNTVSVLLGAGAGGFAAKTDFTTGAGPISVAVADVNGDGRQDLVTADFYASNVSVLLGNGSGGFAPHADFPTGAGPISVAVGDFNGDGKQDLVTANNGASTVSVLLGNGSGGFGAKTDFATGAAVQTVAVGDFNGDGKLDLVTANDGGSSVSVLLYQLSTPSGTMIIEGGAAATGGALVRIDSAASDATEMRLRNQGAAWNAWQPYAASVYWRLPSGDGTKTVEAQYRNSLGQTLIVSDSILLDTAAPTTTDDAPAGWQTAGLTVHLTPSDGSGSGVAFTQYKLDGATSWSTGTSVAVSTDGTHTIRYRSTDAAGNREETESCTVKIDTTAPVTTQFGADSAWHAGPLMVLFAATDAGSGVASTEYSLDGGGSWSFGFGLLFTSDGDHVVRYRSTDNAGNTETYQSLDVKIDTTAPTTTDNTDGLPHQVFSLVLTPADATSGVASTQYRIDGGPWQTGTTTTLRLAIRHKRPGLAAGDHLIEYRSIDNAGNTESIKSCTVTL